LNPLKDEIYDLQKSISDELGQKLKETLLKYYYENDFLDLTLTFIDGHIVAYFGKESFQKLKHSTRNEIIKAMEIFNFSDKRGRIFYFKADHDVKGMQFNIEKLLLEVKDIIGLDKIKILVFDRGGFSHNLFNKLNKMFNLNFITLAVKNPKIVKQIEHIIKLQKFNKFNNKSINEYMIVTLKFDSKNYRTLLVRNNINDKIHPFITNMNHKQLSDEDLLKYYSMHWNQEQEHNAFGKLGGNMHSKILQDCDFEDTTKIEKSIRISNRINKLNSDDIKLSLELGRIEGLKISLTSKIKPKSKQTDDKLLKKRIQDYNFRVKMIKKTQKAITLELILLKKRLKKILEHPQKKKYKSGPIDYSISIFNLANNLHSKLIQIATKGKGKFQLSTMLGTFYSIPAYVSEDEKNIYVEYFNIRQKKQVQMVQNLCDYFNPKKVKLRDKVLNFTIKQVEK